MELNEMEVRELLRKRLKNYLLQKFENVSFTSPIIWHTITEKILKIAKEEQFHCELCHSLFTDDMKENIDYFWTIDYYFICKKCSEKNKN